jgi:hypothetical protein
MLTETEQRELLGVVHTLRRILADHGVCKDVPFSVARMSREVTEYAAKKIEDVRDLPLPDLADGFSESE